MRIMKAGGVFSNTDLKSQVLENRHSFYPFLDLWSIGGIICLFDQEARLKQAHGSTHPIFSNTLGRPRMPNVNVSPNVRFSSTFSNMYSRKW